jgi:hypothetical protein
MSLDVQILGGDQLKKLAAQINASGERGLGREMANGLRKASKPVQRSISSEYEGLPAGGGYKALFSQSLRFRTQLRTGARQASFRLTTFADGKGERRDIDSLEDGELRHPVYGRRRRKWSTTRVRGGFHRRGTDNAADLAEKEMSIVLRDFAAKLIT